ncbi:unnamed protein product, partial [Medioppia subpectinata]
MDSLRETIRVMFYFRGSWLITLLLLAYNHDFNCAHCVHWVWYTTIVYAIILSIIMTADAITLYVLSSYGLADRVLLVVKLLLCFRGRITSMD